MLSPLSWIAGAGLGAGAMYYLDPDRGRRRRALMRDQCVRACSQTARAADVVQRDVTNRVRGSLAAARGRLSADHASDEVLVNRVRSRIGRVVSHPSAIEVRAQDGVVTLLGPVLSHEEEALLTNVNSVRGVTHVENRLHAHPESSNIPGLQGEARRNAETWEWFEEYWSPAMRAGVGALGGALLAKCLVQRTPGSQLLGMVGFGLSARAVTNLPFERLLGFGPGRRGLDIQAAININAPIHQVFELFSNPENYPRLTDWIAETRRLGDDRFEKDVALPGGVSVTLREAIVRRAPNQLMQWRSEPGSAVKYAGTAWFTELDEHATRVQVCMTYNPPGGALAHTLASTVGLSPKQMMDDFLMRAKAYLETGRQPRDASDQTAPTGEQPGVPKPLEA